MFALQTIADVVAYEKPNQPAAGVQPVLVKGVGVVSNGTLVEDTAPGRSIRREVK